jgi:poly(3-hydroxybutyrate) depolymerase
MNRFSYQLYEMAHLSLAPVRMMSDAARFVFKNPLNPLAHTVFGKNIAASAEIFERLTRRYGKPLFSLNETFINNHSYEIVETCVWEKPFCKLIHFDRSGLDTTQPNLVIVAPMSGHYATLLRGTVEAFLPHYNVYITDWQDARMVPLSVGRFDLDDYIDYLIEMFTSLSALTNGAPIHTLGVCQPSVPLIAATALMEAKHDKCAPASMILMGGPIDTRKSPTAVNTLAQERGSKWFKDNCIFNVPFPYPGMGRKVYPGFLQLSGFMAMNLDRHVNAHVEMFNHLVEGDGDSAEKHRDFYDEYMAVMDLDADYYLQTIDTVFVDHALPKGEMRHRSHLVDLNAIHTTGLMTVEGEKDDISGVGQTYAAHYLCPNIPADLKKHHLQLNVGHYGVFNGSRFRKDIVPNIISFIDLVERRRKN